MKKEIKERLKKNPETTNSFLWTVISSILFITLPKVFGVIALIISDRYLIKAKKKNEDKKLRKIGNLIIFIPVLIWIFGAILWAIKVIYVTE
jgi:ABC-type sugar transport system permease subunit